MLTESSPTATVRKIMWRLSPFLALAYFVAYLDRSNVSFASLTMNADIGLSGTAYGMGAGLFFIGYLFFEIPSNLALQRYGARRWIARIMISWGLVASLMAFISAPWQFYVLRFVLGAAEAGFYPGILLYFTYWFPSSYCARVIAFLVIANPVASCIGAPLSTAILSWFDGSFGIAGWRWLFIVEGIPAILVGLLALRCLLDDPSLARWLSPDEKQWLISTLKAERTARAALVPQHWLAAVGNWKVIIIILIMALNSLASYGVGFWLPQLIKSFHVSTLMVGWLTAVPYACAACAVIAMGLHSDAKRERVWHIFGGATVAAIGLTASGMTLRQPAVNMVFISLAMMGVIGMMPVFWTATSLVLGSGGAAVGFAFVNSMGNVTGYFGPLMVGWITDTTGSFSISLYILGIAAFIMGLLIFGLRRFLISAELPDNDELVASIAQKV
jgi:MFS transporter, ACS family, tartrate transporter